MKTSKRRPIIKKGVAGSVLAKLKYHLDCIQVGRNNHIQHYGHKLYDKCLFVIFICLISQYNLSYHKLIYYILCKKCVYLLKFGLS